jgi:hypothetical protein
MPSISEHKQNEERTHHHLMMVYEDEDDDDNEDEDYDEKCDSSNCLTLNTSSQFSDLQA